MSYFFAALNNKEATTEKNAIYPDINLCFDGNSITRSHHENLVEQYMPLRVYDWLSPKCKSLNFNSFGVGGQNIQQMLDNYSTKIDPEYVDGVLNILIVNEDYNGIYGQEFTGQDNLDKVNSYLTLANATGWDIIITWNAWYPRTPYSGNVDATSNARFQDWLDLVDGGGLVGNTHHVDTRDLPNVGGSAGQAQDEYFFDQVHLNVIGNIELYAKFRETLRTILEAYRLN